MSMILKTSQVSQFKTAIDTIKDLIQDVNIHFIKDDHSNAGMLLISMDNSSQSLVYFRITKSEVDKSGFYKCSEACSAGINIPEFNKMLKTIKDKDTLTLQIKPKNPGILFLGSENIEKAKIGEYEINLMDIDDDELEIPNEQFNSVITLDSSEFQQLCRDVNTVVTDKVKIMSTGTEFIMSSVGENATATFRLGEKQGIVFDNINMTLLCICNEYPIKFLICFSKASKLCTTLSIHLKQDFPIVIDYPIASLGMLRFVLSPLLSTDKNEPEPLPKKIIQKNRRTIILPPL